MPHDLLPWYVVYQQMRRWMAAQWFTVTGFVSPSPDLCHRAGYGSCSILLNG
jgi:hypothetical protein